MERFDDIQSIKSNETSEPNLINESEQSGHIERPLDKHEVVSVVKEINSLSNKELRAKFSDEELFKILSSLPVYFEDGLISEDLLDAEARIYSVYEPSEVLQKEHRETNFSVIDSYDPRELFQLRESWETLDINKKIIFIEGYVERLATSYGMNQKITTVLYDESSDGASATWLPSHEPDTLGVLILYKSTLEQGNLSSALSVLSHEMAHGFQEFIGKQKDGVVEDFSKDREWFAAYQARHKEKTNYVDAYKASYSRYLAIPVEKDAWEMQLYAPDRLNSVADEYVDRVLAAEGMDSYSEIKRQMVVAKWVTRKLRETTDVDTLLQEARKVAENFPDTAAHIISFILSRNNEDLESGVKDIEEKKRRADELLALSTK